MLCSTCVVSLCHLAWNTTGSSPPQICSFFSRGFVLASPAVPLRGPFPEPFLIGRPCFQTGHRSTCAAEIDQRPVGDLAAASSRRRDVRGTCDDRCVSLLRKHVLTCCDPPAASRGAEDARIQDETRVEEERDAEHGRKGRASFFFFRFVRTDVAFGVVQCRLLESCGTNQQETTWIVTKSRKASDAPPRVRGKEHHAATGVP